MFDVARWSSRYGSYFTFFEARSLDLLQDIGPVDAVLIDGDHNWYTVYHELCLIEDISSAHRCQLPFVLLHGSGWPYDRRVAVHVAAAIPPDHRKPFCRMGMKPEVSELQSAGGLNRKLDDAAYESGPQNGVLTAVEDFIRTREVKIRRVQIPGFHGLSILASLASEKKDPILRMLDAGPEGEMRPQLVASLERDRVEAEIRQAALVDQIEQEQSSAVQRLSDLEHTLETERVTAASNESGHRVEIQQLEVELKMANDALRRSNAVEQLLLTEVDIQLTEGEATTAIRSARTTVARRQAVSGFVEDLRS
jgi:hypothetical protein